MNTWDYEVSTFLTNWKEDLMKYSIPTLVFTLTEKERDDFSSLIFSEGNSQVEQERFAYFVNKIAPAFHVFPEGIFLRNDKRSPKDSDAFLNGKLRPARTAQEAISFCLLSERTWVDFRDAKEHGHLPILVARKWMDFKPEREFRCFIKNGRLFAITQYDYQNHYEWVTNHVDSIKARIISFIEEIKSLLPCDTLVVDVHINDQGITIIETNPYGLSDPCLFEDYEQLETLYQDEPDSIRFLYRLPLKVETNPDFDKDDLFSLLDS
ncbi:ATP-grasp domain-containing protein (plasmid) [Aneurinibacillus sp. Ricciae_BoGa-3]|uniref:ATP-grasp domain-containing protein n=1 Tax=Aneurinibacillus sp. Ricciae_BoGa-3 TaxID=3022697 RepID=UPI00234100DF|nr:ATP-grasp domain-containing protein [Aneurinibacillus sp. Ricciae_BoGa-3]WCK57306.1 ATP-grasp domain-containing protein [Aneurinibacillus sp. Ricciae_BoGa-3]